MSELTKKWDFCWKTFLKDRIMATQFLCSRHSLIVSVDRLCLLFNKKAGYAFLLTASFLSFQLGTYSLIHKPETTMLGIKLLSSFKKSVELFVSFDD